MIGIFNNIITNIKNMPMYGKQERNLFDNYKDDIEIIKYNFDIISNQEILKNMQSVKVDDVKIVL